MQSNSNKSIKIQTLFSTCSVVLFTALIWLNFAEFSSAQLLIVQNSISQTELEQIPQTVGDPILTGQEGNYTAKILINAPIEKVWTVLTDYNNFPNFLPTVSAVKILESNGNQKVYEQTNVVQVLFFSQSSKIAIAATETYPSSISFQLREGDSIKALKGSWKLEPISANQVLVTNQVAVEPSPNVPRDFFFNIYSENLSKTLAALKQETEKRLNTK
jgi:ribosome-associated toxin RatA of RatAB toxin-antitoxin module